MRLGKYITMGLLGSGTYGTVYKAKEQGVNNKVVAIKQIHQDEVEEGIPPSTIREIGILLEFREENNKNIVRLLEIIHQYGGHISLVFEYVEYDLKKFQEEFSARTLNRDSPGGSMSSYSSAVIGLPVGFARSVTRQILEALMFCHQHKVLHRDVKPSNLLVTLGGVVKLADFGLSRTYSFPNRTYCHEVVTLWYRAPEIMLGAGSYKHTVDIWSAGCIIPELLTGKVLFTGDSEIHQLFLVFKKFGTPTEADWPGVTTLPDYKAVFPRFERENDIQGNHYLPRDAQILITRMLLLDPDRRGTAKELLTYRFVAEAMPTMPLNTILPM